MSARVVEGEETTITLGQADSNAARFDRSQFAFSKVGVGGDTMLGHGSS
jgi:hypothetical protein